MDEFYALRDEPTKFFIWDYIGLEYPDFDLVLSNKSGDHFLHTAPIKHHRENLGGEKLQFDIGTDLVLLMVRVILSSMSPPTAIMQPK